MAALQELRCLSAAEVARMLAVSSRTITRYCSMGVFEGAFLVGSRWRIPEGSLQTYVESRQAHAASIDYSKEEGDG